LFYRTQPPTLPIALTLLVLASSACASMQQRVTESENRSQTTEAQVADLQATQQEIINTLTMLRADLEAALDPIRAQQASGGADLRTLQAEIVALRAQLTLLLEQQAASAAAGDMSMGGQPQERPATTPTTTPVTPVRTGASSDEDNLFNAAYADYTAGQFVLAVSGFEELLLRHPTSQRGADALYWIGESLAAQELHAEARARFLQVTQSYPGSAKVPDAVLRAALEAVELGQLEDAVRELLQLVAAHANSDAALIGCMQLDGLGQPLPAGCRIP